MGLSIQSCMAVLTNQEKGYIVNLQNLASAGWLVTLASLYILTETRAGAPFEDSKMFYISYFVFQYVIEFTRIIIAYAMYIRNRDIITPSKRIISIMWWSALVTILIQVGVSLYAGAFNFCIWLDSPCKAIFEPQMHGHNLAMVATDVQLSFYYIFMDIYFFHKFMSILSEIGNGLPVKAVSKKRFQISLYVLSFVIGGFIRLYSRSNCQSDQWIPRRSQYWFKIYLVCD